MLKCDIGEVLASLYCLADSGDVCDGASAVLANGRGALDFSLLMVPE